jgi:hypothetical protein
MNPAGVVLVARQEFRIRLRTGRWRWLLGAWVLVIGGFTLLLDLSLETGYAFGTEACPCSASSCCSCSAWCWWSARR